MRNASSANSFAGDASYICIVSDREYTVFSLALATYVFICSQGGGNSICTERIICVPKRKTVSSRRKGEARKLFSRSTGGRKELKRNNHYKSGTLALNFFLAEQYIR